MPDTVCRQERARPVLRRRIESPAKLSRLRSLANIVLGRVSDASSEKKVVEALADERREDCFLKRMKD
jgi:hypothetical protein